MIGLPSRSPVLRLRIGRSTLRAEAIERGSVTWAGEASYANLAELADAIARLAAEPPRACRRLVVALDRPPVQLRTLTELPPVKPLHLAALVAQQARRFFRKNRPACWATKAARCRSLTGGSPVSVRTCTGGRSRETTTRWHARGGSAARRAITSESSEMSA